MEKAKDITQEDDEISALQKEFLSIQRAKGLKTTNIPCSSTPSYCPYDTTALLDVHLHLKEKGISGKEGQCFYCRRCSRFFVYEKGSKRDGHKRTKLLVAIEEPGKEYPEKAPSVQAGTQPKKVLVCPSEIKEEPGSTILTAKLRHDKHGIIGCIAIVEDQHEQDPANGIYWVGRALPSAILAAVRTNDQRFSYKDITYQIADTVKYASAEKYLKIISRFSDPRSPQTVYVFAQKNISSFQRENYETVTAMVPCADRVYPIPITVFYDRTSQTYFINEATYTDIRKQYGLPYLRLQNASCATPFTGFAGLKQYSELYLLGYNVAAAGGMSSEERRRLLTNIIDSGVLWKGEVISHLEWLIHTKCGIPLMATAVEKWQEDLRYIRGYRSEEQRKVWIDRFKSKYSEYHL